MKNPTLKLGKKAQDIVISKIIRRLEEEGFFSAKKDSYKLNKFYSYREIVRNNFYISETSITPIMARLLYALAATKKPKNIVGIGTYMGNALAWLSGPLLIDKADQYKIIGVDIDEKATEIARDNFSHLPNNYRVDFINEDGFTWLSNYKMPIDLLYIDIDSEQDMKKGYSEILKLAMPNLAKDALILAHDVSVDKFEDDFKIYFELVKDRTHFNNSITLDIDACGLEVTIY